MGAVEETSVVQAQDMFDTNVFGVMRMVREVLPQMHPARRGRIINISSVVGLIPSPYMATYAERRAQRGSGNSGRQHHRCTEKGAEVVSPPAIRPAVSGGPR
ncbi:SDR family NAD(P)-dependent oxidoreductase [Streptomyces sp. NBC_01604]|uniref:SDR family NAD(P)-dependent oxidoreductase n=1 Tax=Streptomyces sp. NBC_01604 TaxID=2975894 RepID=UPI00386E2DE0